MKTILLLFAVLAAPAYSQSVTNVTCYGYGGTSCFHQFSGLSGSLTCTCNAFCSNSNSISASYNVYWACPQFPATGQVDGGQQGWGVLVNGSVVTFNVSGWSLQYCTGVQDLETFEFEC